MRFDPRARSKLIIEGIAMPVGSDRAMKERLLHLPDRGKLRRDIDGEAVWCANAAGGRVYGLEISTDDVDVPALDGVWEGQTYWITPTQQLKAVIWPGTTSVTLDRVPIAAGLDPHGILVQDQMTGASVAGWTQSGENLRTINIPAARTTATIVHYRFRNEWMINNNITIDRDVPRARSSSRMTFEEVRGS